LLQHKIGLAASYRRRVLYVSANVAIAGACLFSGAPAAMAQTGAPPAVPDPATKTTAKKTAGKQTSKKKSAGTSLKVVPIPRSDTRAAGPQAAPGAGPQNPSAPGAGGG
jgi:hypothetical protein